MGISAFSPRDDTVSVGTSAVDLSPETGSKQRQVLIITNTSAGGQNISLSWNKDAVDGYGVVLYPGEHHVEAIDASFIPLNFRISAVASAAGGVIAIHERLINPLG
jgi:hypothetical protein